MLRDLRDCNERSVSDEKKAAFYTEAELNVRYLFLERELNY